MNNDEKVKSSEKRGFLNLLTDYPTILSVFLVGGALYYFNKFLNYRKFPSYDEDSVPESCPGPGTENAGKSKTCEGCPNKSFCSSNNPNSGINQVPLNNSIKDVDNIIIVASGKGGVGKSTVATQLSFSLDYLGKKVGLLDVDITGPSIPSMTGTTKREVFESLLGWTPVYLNENMSIMSIGYLMNNDEGCISWRGAKKDALIKKFLTNVDWGNLDYLVIDTPPGTSDEHITLVNTIKTLINTNSDNKYNKENKEGNNNSNNNTSNNNKKVKSILVTTPQKRSIDDAKRTAQFCRDLGIDIILLVENMTNSFLDTFNNTKTTQLTNGLKEENLKMIKDLCNKFNIPQHVRVDSDPAITEAGELGYFIPENNPFLNIAKSFLN